MDVARWFSKRIGFYLLAAGSAVLLAAVTLSVTSAHADDNISVACYRGDMGNGAYLGTILVFSPDAAGQMCNSLYYGCGGKCFGCFSDFDLSEDVCYDSSGRKFLK